LKLLAEHSIEANVRILGWCLMTNHTHLIAVPEREDSLAVLLRRVHGRYAQYYNARAGRVGHLWQNRYFACALGIGHLWRALVYVERNPVRAGMVMRAEEYRWSSALPHCTGRDERKLIDMDWWSERDVTMCWSEVLNQGQDDAQEIERCTFSGKPFGNTVFVQELSERFGRHWMRGRPKKNGSGAVRPGEAARREDVAQGLLFTQ
jgi:putative transposase